MFVCMCIYVEYNTIQTNNLYNTSMYNIIFIKTSIFSCIFLLENSFLLPSIPHHQFCNNKITRTRRMIVILSVTTTINGAY